MPRLTPAEILSSESRLRIAVLLSTRPRSLRELASLTGISVQGVLKHLDKLDALGVLDEKKVDGGGTRKLYSLKEYDVRDLSVADLTIVRVARKKEAKEAGAKPFLRLNFLAEDALLQRRRAREQARRLERTLGVLADEEASIRSILGAMRLTDEEKSIALAHFTEETTEDAAAYLEEHLGLKDARGTIDRVLTKAKRIG